MAATARRKAAAPQGVETPPGGKTHLAEGVVASPLATVPTPAFLPAPPEVTDSEAVQVLESLPVVEPLASQAVVSEDKRVELARHLEEAGLTPRLLIEAVKGGLKATLRRRAGNGAYELAADHDARLRAVAEGRGLLQLAGAMPSKLSGDEGAGMVLTVERFEPDGNGGYRRMRLEARG